MTTMEQLIEDNKDLETDLFFLRQSMVGKLSEIERLRADKAELVEGLEAVYEQETINGSKSKWFNVYNLIQKHK